MTPNRRDFLRAMLLTAGATAFGSVSMAEIGQVAAAPLTGGNPDFRRRFIFCYFNGAWDTLLSADPRDPRIFTPEVRGTTQVDPGYARLPSAYSQGGTEGNGLYVDDDLGISLGPAAGPVWKHRADMCVVRGISMATVTHEVGRRYFTTGRMPNGLTARGSSIATEIAAQLHGEGAPSNMPFVPNLAYAVESYNDRHPSFASGLKISSVNDLLDALRRPDLGYSEPEERLIADYLHKPESFGLPMSRMTDALNRARRSEIQAEAVLAARLDNRLRFPDGLNLNSPQAIGMLAVQAITQQISTAVSLRVSDSLDTHFDEWATDQPARQFAAFEVIDQIITALKTTAYPDGSGRSWFDFTTIMAFSEFARTPLLNARDGRDHHPVNSCMMWGAGIPKGRVIGASTEYGVLASPINLRTGLPDAGGHVLRPEDILATVMANSGLAADFLARDLVYIPALEPLT